MKALLILAHYFKPEENSIYSSTSAGSREQRKAAFERVLTQWRALFGGFRELQVYNRQFLVHKAQAPSLDIVVLINEDRHLLDQELVDRFKLRIQKIVTPNPRYLPFGAHNAIQKAVSGQEYDWYIYSEDDLVPHDPYFLRKQIKFQNVFGTNRILQPNRYEINPANPVSKTYVDGHLREERWKQLWSHVEESEPTLHLSTDLGDIYFERAKNPHSGFFMLSAKQASHWVTQPHFMDLDCSFISPLESAGSLSLLKTFSLYKTSGQSMPWFEIHHQDTKFSRMKLPETKHLDR